MKLLVRFIVYFVLGLALGASFYYGCARAADATLAGLRCDGWPITDNGDGILGPEDCYSNAPIDTAVLRFFGQKDYCIQYPEQLPNRLRYELWRQYPACQRIAKVTLEWGWPGHGATRVGIDRDAMLTPQKVNLAAPGMVDAILRYLWELRQQRIYAPNGMRLPVPAWVGLHLEVCGNPNDSAWTAAYEELLRRIPEELPGWSLWLNCGAPTARSGWSWMLENFPYQGGVPGDPKGGFPRLLSGQAGPRPIVFASSTLDSALNLQRREYAFACALLFDGLAIFEPAEPNDGTQWWRWKYHRYDLGKPRSGVYVDKGLYVRRFERGTVLVNPSAGTNAARGHGWILEVK